MKKNIYFAGPELPEPPTDPLDEGIVIPVTPPNEGK